jgi:hypothetical protein
MCADSCKNNALLNPTFEHCDLFSENILLLLANVLSYYLKYKQNMAAFIGLVIPSVHAIREMSGILHFQWTVLFALK